MKIEVVPGVVQLDLSHAQVCRLIRGYDVYGTHKGVSFIVTSPYVKDYKRKRWPTVDDRLAAKRGGPGDRGGDDTPAGED